MNSEKLIRRWRGLEPLNPAKQLVSTIPVRVSETVVVISWLSSSAHVQGCTVPYEHSSGSNLYE
eukprot:scaffold109475_cov52-Prasinocladus_malaysianus.AAC.1